MSSLRFSIVAMTIAALLAAAPHAAAQAAAAAAPAVPDGQPAAFSPPANGHLTAAQVRMFIAMRRAMGPVAATSREPSDQVNALTATLEQENRAASDLRVNLDEYRWVSAQIAEVMPASTANADALLNAIAAAVRGAGTAIAANENAPRQASAAASDTPSPALAYNRQLLKRFETELRAVIPASNP